MAAKKSDKAATSKVVEVPVPAGQPIQAGDIHRAALTLAREHGDKDIPLLAPTSFDFGFDGDPSDVKDGNRTYKVKISWVNDDAGDPVDLAQQAGAVFTAGPTALTPVGDDKPA